MLAKGSAHIILLPFVVATILVWLAWFVLAVVFILIGCFLLLFFRDPTRQTGEGIVAAADGVIREVSEVNNTLMISTFMNLHNVHVNRAPLAGRVRSVERFRGRHAPAFLSKATENSRVTVVLDTELGEVRVNLIAGVFAWRIVPYVKAGQEIRKGARFSMIRFGSRVDVYLPRDRARPAVREGRKVKAGCDTIAGLVK